jgi:hypothetical protein
MNENGMPHPDECPDNDGKDTDGDDIKTDRLVKVDQPG